MAAVWTNQQLSKSTDDGMPMYSSACDFISEDCKATEIGSKQYGLEIANTPAEHAVGLSGRNGLMGISGMLFVFDEPGHYPFWMKDTLIPLDMIWLDEQGIVQEIEQNVQPGSYPANFGGNFNSKYVIELKAGQVVSNGLKVGDIVPGLGGM